MAPRKGIVRTIRSANCDELIARRVTGISCDLCRENVDDELTFGNLYKIGDIAVHYFCVLLSSGSEQHGDDDEGLLGFLYKDISKEVKRSKKNTCASCKKKGATLGCAQKTCKKQYHLPCARRDHATCLFYDTFEVFCKQHSQKQQIPDRVLAARIARLDIKTEDGVPLPEKQCQICLQEVEQSPSYDTFWPPCCGAEKDEWFHRSCLERLAFHAGLYHLKCPLCNNKKEFNEALERCGYYIPDRDASWEREENAFEEPPPECHAEGCLNRSRDDDTGEWRLVVCVSCGGEALHERCAVTLPHRCSTCWHPTEHMALTPLPTVREIERGDQPPVMTTRMSLRRTMPRAVLNNSRLFLARNKRANVTTTCEEQILRTPKMEPDTVQASPSKLIREQLNYKIALLGLSDVDVDKIIETIFEKMQKPGPRSKKRDKMLEIIECIFENLPSKVDQSELVGDEAGPSTNDNDEPLIDLENIKTECATPVKSNRTQCFVSPSRSNTKRGQISPVMKSRNLENTLQRIKQLSTKQTDMNVVTKVEVNDVHNGSETCSKDKDSSTTDSVNDISNCTTNANGHCNDRARDNIDDSDDATMDISIVKVETTRAYLQSPNNIDMDTSSIPLIEISDDDDEESEDDNVKVNVEGPESSPKENRLPVKKNLMLRYFLNENDSPIKQIVQEARDSIFKKTGATNENNVAVTETNVTNEATIECERQNSVSIEDVPDDDINDNTQLTALRERKKYHRNNITKDNDSQEAVKDRSANNRKIAESERVNGESVEDVQDENHIDDNTLLNSRKRKNSHDNKVTEDIDSQEAVMDRRQKKPKILCEQELQTDNKMEIIEKADEDLPQVSPLKMCILKDGPKNYKCKNLACDELGDQVADEEVIDHPTDTKTESSQDISVDVDADKKTNIEPLKYINPLSMPSSVQNALRKLKQSKVEEHRCMFNHNHEPSQDLGSNLSTAIEFAKAAALQKEIDELQYNMALEEQLLKACDKQNPRDGKRKRNNVELSIGKKKRDKKTKTRVSVRDKQFKLKIMFKDNKLHFEIDKKCKSKHKRRSDGDNTIEQKSMADIHDTDEDLAEKKGDTKKQTFMHRFITVTPR